MSASACLLTDPDSRPAPTTSSPVRVRHVAEPVVAIALAREQQVRKREARRDRELVLRAQRGDRSAFEVLMVQYEKRAFALAISLLRDENDAREVVQEAFLRVFRGLRTFNGEASFFTWLYRIVKNLSIDVLRRPTRRETESLEGHDFDHVVGRAGLARGHGGDALEQISRREIAARVAAGLATLPSYHRSVIVMRELQGLSYEEMAQAMGVSKGTIMSRLFHARRKLQLVLGDCYREQAG